MDNALRRTTTAEPRAGGSLRVAAARWLAALLFGAATGAAALPPLPVQPEVEPNNTPAQATLLQLNGGRAIGGGSITAGDADYWRIDYVPVNAKIWIFVDTGGTQNAGANSRDSVLTLLASDGTSVIETDDDNGTGNGLDTTVESTQASVIAGRTLSGGTYYIKVNAFLGTAVVDPYRLYVVVTRANLPLPEVESNNTPGNADPLLGASATAGVRTGSIGIAGDVDLYSIVGRAGDIIFVAGDGDPARTGAGTDIVLNFMLLDGSTVLISCDNSLSGSVSNPAGEGCAYRLTNSGTYYLGVQHHSASGTGPYWVMAANMTRMVVDAIAEAEPNDSPGTANLLPLNRGRATVLGKITAGDTDWYRIDIKDAATKVWALADTGGPQNAGSNSQRVTLSIYDGNLVLKGTDSLNGTANGLDETIEQSNTGTVAAVPGGTMYLKVEGVTASAVVDPYRLLVVVTPYEGNDGIENEPNDTPATANAMATEDRPAYQRQGNVDGSGDPDWYKVSAAAGDVIFVSIDSYNIYTDTGVDMVAEIYAPDATTLLLTCDSGGVGSALATATEGCAYQVGPGGTYYVKARPFSAAVTSGFYEIMVANMTQPSSPDPFVQFADYPHNTPANAGVLTLNGWRAVGRSEVDPVGDVTYWRVDGIPQNSKIWAYVDTGTVTTGSTDSKLSLLAADGTTVIEMDDDDGTGNGLDGTVESGLASVIAGRTLNTGGTYYLKVEHFDGTEKIVPYMLYVAVTPPFLILSENEPNGSKLDSDVILLPGALVQARNSSISPAGDLDYFKFTADAGDVVFFALDGDPGRIGAGPNFVIEVLDENGIVPLLTCDSSATSSASNSAAEGCAYRFKVPGVYYARVREFAGTSTGPYMIMVANMSTRLTLDVDQSYPATVYDALTDGMLAVRHMAVPANTNVTNGVTGAAGTRTVAEIGTYLNTLRSALDIDGDGVVDPATDGVLILRYLMGIRGPNLIANAISPNATRTQYGQILAYLEALTP